MPTIPGVPTARSHGLSLWTLSALLHLTSAPFLTEGHEGEGAGGAHLSPVEPTQADGQNNHKQKEHPPALSPQIGNNNHFFPTMFLQGKGVNIKRDLFIHFTPSLHLL